MTLWVTPLHAAIDRRYRVSAEKPHQNAVAEWRKRTPGPDGAIHEKVDEILENRAA
jgi:hypothetical protein